MWDCGRDLWPRFANDLAIAVLFLVVCSRLSLGSFRRALLKKNNVLACALFLPALFAGDFCGLLEEKEREKKKKEKERERERASSSRPPFEVSVGTLLIRVSFHSNFRRFGSIDDHFHRGSGVDTCTIDDVFLERVLCKVVGNSVDGRHKEHGRRHVRREAGCIVHCPTVERLPGLFECIERSVGAVTPR